MAVPAALGRLHLARALAGAHLEGSRSGVASGHGVARRMAALGRSADLHGRPSASARVSRSYVGRLLHRQVGRRHAHDPDDAPERRLRAAQRPAAQRQGDADRTLDAARRRPDRGDDRLRPGLSHRAVHSHDRLRARSAPAEPAVSVRGGRGGRSGERPGAAQNSRRRRSLHHRVREALRDSRRGGEGRRGNDVSRVPFEAAGHAGNLRGGAAMTVQPGKQNAQNSQNTRNIQRRIFSAISAVSAVSAFLIVTVTAQRGGTPQPPASPRAAAPYDFTGYWVSVVTEDWRWRMMTPARGDYASVPLNAEAERVADAWDPAKDE